MDRYTLHLGDCLETLRAMPACSVDSVVTDPPYGLAFMGKRWDYDVPSTEIWAECLRVLKPGGHLLAFAGTRTQHRMAVRIEDAGFEIRDMIAWVYGSGFPKSHNLAGDREGWGTALKPALEPITIARKPLAGTVAANVQLHGTGAINIDGCRVETPDDTARISNGAIRGGNFAAGSSAPGPIGGGHAAGRWPANMIHDGSDEVTTLFPSTGGAAAPVHKRNGDKFRNSYGTFQGNVDEAGSTYHADTGSAARFFYCAKTSRKDRNEGLQDPGPQLQRGTTLRKVENADLKGNNHPTVKPTDLMAYLCRLVTPPGGIVLDPFMGSGSTGKAALREGFQFIGCELEESYMAIARARIEHEAARLDAIAASPVRVQFDIFA
ncbi:DNA-methyltransferase [Pseudomonas rhizoryzae]|uniref:DNA-methyltransferase n=1 Tax=Pseudomonas rhizoryzae TaxID=2571129 RepID=UPI0010C20FE9|nr:site-specific DNA-methyltransferase [Pseudomonas rhizoryzae]